MILTNPDRIINVRELYFFRQQSDNRYRTESVMTAQQAETLFDSIFTDDSDSEEEEDRN